MQRVAIFASLLAIAFLGLTRSPWVLAGAQEATPAAECSVSTEEENVAVARRFLEDAIGGHDASVLTEIMAPRVVYHAATGKDIDTVEEVIPLIAGTINSFPDVHYTIDLTITEGDLVAFTWHAEGTNTGDFQGRPPTGKHASWTGTNAFRLECGRIVEAWAEIDALGRMRQLGLLATPTP